MELTKQFYTFLAQDSKLTEGLEFYPVFSDGLSSTLAFMWQRHHGACIIFLLLIIDLPSRFIEEKYYNQCTLYLRRIEESSKSLLNKKLLKTTSATNKTISETKFRSTLYESTSMFDCFWKLGEIA